MSVLAKSNQMFGMVGGVIDNSASVSNISHEYPRKYMKHRTVSQSTFMKHLKKLSTLTETKIARELPHILSIVFDRLWEMHTTRMFSLHITDFESVTKN